MPSHSRMTAKEKQQRYRARLRSQGLRPVQIWVPDTKVPGFAEECRRQAQRINSAAGEQESLDFIDDIAGWDDQ